VSSNKIFEYEDASGDKLSVWAASEAIPAPAIQIDGRKRSLMVVFHPEDAKRIAAAILEAAGQAEKGEQP
jgi:GMP synthase-like glutamine amidotransferase